MSAGYRVLLTPRALKEWKSLPQDAKWAVGRAIDKLARECREAGVKKLGRAGWRLRVRDYRILFDRHRREHIDEGG